MQTFSEKLGEKAMDNKMEKLNIVIKEARKAIDETFMQESYAAEKITDLNFILVELITPYLYALKCILKKEKLPEDFLDILKGQVLKSLENCPERVKYSCTEVED